VVRLGVYICSLCGRKITRAYFLSGNPNPFGSGCARKRIGLGVVPTPEWILGLADAYIQWLFSQASKKEDIKGPEELMVDFFDHGEDMPWGGKLSPDSSVKAYVAPIKINGKLLTLEFQNDLARRIVDKRMEGLQKRGWA
jgi:hypothetical protein